MSKKTMLLQGGCAVGALAIAAVCSGANAQQITNQIYEQPVTVNLLPIASLQFVGSNLLYLEIPPPGSTAPSSGVDFVVTGNANATLTAEPDEFVEIGGQHLGKATLNSESVGYNIEVRFPKAGVPGSPVQIAGLPGFEEGPTTPLTVDLTETGMERGGVIHMESDPNWTPHGGIPLPGIYTGNVVLTLVAGN